MSEVEIQPRDSQSLRLVQPLWEALFDHHLSLGAAGFPTIPRETSWPLRRKHYEELFAEKPNAALWLATLNGDVVGYALAYEDELDGERAVVLETLSVLPGVRGHGVGTRFMHTVDQWTRQLAIRVGVLDVMGGNPRARELYLRYGYRPYSESWMRSVPSSAAPTSRSQSVDARSLAEAAGHLALHLSTSPGPDDTWQSADDIVNLSTARSTTWVTSPVTAKLSEGHSGRETGDVARLRELFATLVDAGLWTIRFEIPAPPEAGDLREFLQAEGFLLSTERLVHTV